MIRDSVQEKKAYLPPVMDIICLSREMPLMAYSNGEYGLNETEEKKYLA